MQKITPFLWFDNNAEEAVDLYLSIFKDAKKVQVVPKPAGVPGPGSVLLVSFDLFGQNFTALNGGPLFKFNESVSFVVNCKDQAEIDHYWDSLTADGGQQSQCGWLKDKFGLSWQIVPVNIGQLMGGSGDAAKGQRAVQAMMKMKKLIIADMENA